MASSHRSADHLVLVGMMGSGKSTVGRELAARLDLPFVDVDEAIEDAEQAPIADIFATRGEAAFRDVEARVLSPFLVSAVPAVVALGGGAVTDARNRDALEAGFVVWLRARPTTCAARIGPGGDGRPLLAGGDVLGALTALDAERRSHYEGVADLVVDVDGLTPGEVADRVLAGVTR